MGKHTVISYEERKFIEKHIKAGRSYAWIAHELRRHVQSIYHEVRRAGFKYGEFDADIAQKGANIRKSRSIPNKSAPWVPTAEQMAMLEASMGKGKSKAFMRAQVGVSFKRFNCFMKKNYPHYTSLYGAGLPDLDQKIMALEMQIKIITETLKELMHDIKNN